MPVTATPAIDTTSLLTILGVVAAAWAVITPTARLSFRLCMTRIDWTVIVTLVIAIHALVFEDVFKTLKLYPAGASWPWGLDKNGVVYLLFALLTAFVFWRSQTFRLSPRKLPLFDQLTTSLLHGRKFAELGELLSQHQEELLSTSQAAGYRARLAGWLAPRDKRKLEALALRLAKGPATIPATPPTALDKWRTRLAAALQPQHSPDAQKRAILKKLLSSRDLVSYLTLSHPYLCLEAMEPAEQAVDDFQDRYFEALLANTSSVLFTEIRNSQNRDGGHRLRLPVENQLLNFYCKDILVAQRLNVSYAVGETLLIRLESDEELSIDLNKSLRRYSERGKFNCPIYCGIYFFRIMVLEGLHQYVTDHLWLSYVTHVADRIVRKMRPPVPDDENHEYATPFNYLLYCLVDVTTAWIEDVVNVADEASELSADQQEGRHAYVSFQAAEALGGLVLTTMSSDKLTERLKRDLLEKILFTVRRISRKRHLQPLVHSLMAHLVNPYAMGPNPQHIAAISLIYSKQDQSLKSDTKQFLEVLEVAAARLRQTGY